MILNLLNFTSDFSDALRILSTIVLVRLDSDTLFEPVVLALFSFKLALLYT